MKEEFISELQNKDLGFGETETEIFSVFSKKKTKYSEFQNETNVGACASYAKQNL